MKYIVARVLNRIGDLDFLQRFEAIYPAGALRWTTVCSGNPQTALTMNFPDSAESARLLAKQFVPNFIDGRPIEWRVVAIESLA